MESVRTTIPTNRPAHELTRRAALGGAAVSGLAALLSGISRQAGFAQATPPSAAPDAVVHPNMYSLHADGIEIGYSTSSIDGEPTFSFSYEGIEIAASGDEISVVPVVPGAGWPLGTLVAAYVDAAPDAWARTITLALPDINLENENGAGTPFTTFAVLTRHLTSIAGPALVSGQLQEYELIPLHGTAQAVVF